MFPVVITEDFRNGTKQTVWDKTSVTTDNILFSRKQFKNNLPIESQA